MSDLNAAQNRLVWFDIPVADLERAAAFYRGVLGIGVHVEKSPGYSFAVLEHKDGNGGPRSRPARSAAIRASSFT
jgi:predicted enzyme related to lactoylglutathione lyase